MEKVTLEVSHCQAQPAGSSKSRMSQETRGQEMGPEVQLQHQKVCPSVHETSYLQ